MSEQIKTPRTDSFRYQIKHFQPSMKLLNWVFFARKLEREIVKLKATAERSKAK